MLLVDVLPDQIVKYDGDIFHPVHPSLINGALTKLSDRYFRNQRNMRLTILMQDAEVEVLGTCSAWHKAEEMVLRQAVLTQGMQSTLNPKG